MEKTLKTVKAADAERIVLNLTEQLEETITKTVKRLLKKVDGGDRVYLNHFDLFLEGGDEETTIKALELRVKPTGEITLHANRFVSDDPSDETHNVREDYDLTDERVITVLDKIHILKALEEMVENM